MAFGSAKKEKIKTRRISSLPVMNGGKKDILVGHFSQVKRHKNKQSNYIFENKDLLLSQSNKNELISHYKLFAPNFLYSWENQKLFQACVDHYSNWLDKIIDNNKFAIQKEYKVVRYKRKVYSKKGVLLAKKGDMKSQSVIMKKTTLTGLLNWLIYVDYDQLDSVVKSIPDKAKPQTIERTHKFNKQLNELREKPIWPRVKKLLKSKVNRLLGYMKNPIEFTTGSYMKIPKIGKTLHSYVFKNNENKKYKYWYTFRIGKESIKIPLAYNKKYHGDINDYNLNAAHTVKLNSKNGIDIGLTHEDTHEYFKPLEIEDAINKTKVVGIDLNIATNFCTIATHNSTKQYDYNRKYIEKVVNKVLEFNKEGYNQLKPHEQKDLDALLGGVEFYFKKHISKIINDLIAKGITDVVLEDLNLNETTASFLKDKTLNIKYSRLVRLLRLSSIKTWFKEQANNKGLRVHLTTPSYTSKTCSNCHCVDHVKRDKRLFECHHCGYQADADDNASRNIYNRICVDVLRLSFHTLVNGQYEPLKIKRENVRIELSKLFEAGNEGQRLDSGYIPEISLDRNSLL